MRAGEWVSTGEAAEVLGVTLREMYRRIDAGEVEARRSWSSVEVFVSPPAPQLRLVR